MRHLSCYDIHIDACRWILDRRTVLADNLVNSPMHTANNGRQLHLLLMKERKENVSNALIVLTHVFFLGGGGGGERGWVGAGAHTGIPAKF